MVLDGLERGPRDAQVDQDRDGQVLGHHSARWRERVDERLVLECPIESSGSDNEVHGGIVSGPGDTRVGAPRPLPGHLEFSPLPVATVLRRFVPLYGWKVTRRDRAVASGRQAGRQRSSDRGIASESHGWRRIRGHGRGSGPRLEPSRERNGTNLASRLAGLAEAGQTLVDAEVVRLVGERDDVDFRGLGDVPVKGMTSPVQVFEAALR
jgi:hypothetical protein